ncbi:MAG: tetratricopeptide repeat protein [Phycisphaerae bacterium]|jgi:tetratricopeptide (TPR) repeat protein
MSSSRTPTRAARPPQAPDRAAARWRSGPWPAILAAVLCYASSLGNGFAYDDNPIVRDNPRIRSLDNLAQIWLTDWWLDPDATVQDPTRDRLYRPLTLFSFAVNHAVHGLAPLGYHVVNVLLHALAAALVWRFALAMLESRSVASLAALLFAVHPVHAEAVANVVGRAEVLSTVFLLLGLIALTRGASPPGRAALLSACGAFLAALLSKETAVCYLPVALLALARRFGAARLPWRTWGLYVLALGLPVAVYLPARAYALEARLIRDKVTSGLFNPLRDAEGPARIHGPLSVLGHYARLLIAPADLSCDYGLAIFNPNAGPTVVTVLGAAFAAALLAALRGFAKPRGLWRELAFLAAMFLASYFLISNAVLLIGVSLAERLFYWPSVPALLGAALLVNELHRRACEPGGLLHERLGLLRTLGALLLVALVLRTAVRNPDWRDDFTLFSADVAMHPNGAHLNASLAQLVIWDAERERDPRAREALLRRAAELLDRALAVSARFPQALRQRGKVYLLEGDADRARKFVESALALNPSDEKAQRLLAELGAVTEQDAARLDDLRRQVQENPSDVAARLELGRLLIRVGLNEDALVQLLAAYELSPQDAAVVKAYGEALLVCFQQERALEIFRRAVELDPRDWESHANLSRLLAETDPRAALEHARRANELQPDDVRTQINLAEAYAANGAVAEALRRFERIEAALPQDSPLRAAVRERMRELRP